MCSIAAGLRSRSSTVACIASSTDAKKIRPKPFSLGSGEIFSSAEKIAASVPSLPARISLRLSGARTRCDIRAETKPVWCQEIVELIEHDACPNTHRVFFDVQIGDLAVVPRK